MTRKDYILLLAMIILTIICWEIGKATYTQAKKVWAHSHAPGAQTPPGQSQNGKSDSLDPGGSFNSLPFFEHYAFSHIGTPAKLHPRSGVYTHAPHNGQTIFGKYVWVTNLFNIILIISQTTPKLYLAELSTILSTYVDNYYYSQDETACQVGRSSHFGLFIALVISVRTHGIDRNVNQLSIQLL